MRAKGDFLEQKSTMVLAVVLLVAWVLIVRSPTFFRSALDWDESLYTVVADNWLRGGMPYVDVWDRKPLGIFVIFATFLWTFGRTIIALRIAAVAFVILTSILLYFLGKAIFNNREVGFIAGAIYPALSLGLGGPASNSELFFIPFNLASLLLLVLSARKALPPAKHVIMIFGAGCAAGCALQIKLLPIVEVPLFVTFLFVLQPPKSLMDSWRRHLTTIMVFAGGVLIPTLLAMLYYWSHGLLDEYVSANFGANIGHLPAYKLSTYIYGFFSALLGWAAWVMIPLWGVVFFFVRGAKDSDPGSPLLRSMVFLLAWVAFGLVETMVSGRFAPHYFLVTLPPVCLSFGAALSYSNGFRRTPARMTLLMMGTSVLVLTQYLRTEVLPWGREYLKEGKDDIAKTAQFIRQNIQSGDFIYVVNSDPIIYFLTDAKLPSKYVFPPFITDEFFSSVAGIDYVREVKHILANKPKYVVIRTFTVDDPTRQARIARIRQLLDGQYVFDRKYGPEEVLRRATL